MRNAAIAHAAIAQWILSLVTTPHRAASTVGDLIESRASGFKLWSAVGSSFFRCITPGTFGVALAGFVAQYLVLAVPVMAIIYARPSLLVFPSANILACLATQLLIGVFIGRYAQHRALAACLIVVLMDCMLGALQVNNSSVNMAIWALPLLAGTIAARRLSLRHTPPAKLSNG